MSDIVVRRPHHAATEQKAREGAEKIARRLSEEFDFDYGWDGDVLRFNRTGVHGELRVGRQDVELHVKLSLLLRPLKPRIEHEIHRFFDENIGKPHA